MAFDLIQLSDPVAEPIRLPQSLVNRELASIPLLGAGVENYGEIIAEAQLLKLENFYNTTPPQNPLVGQLWYDSDSDLLRALSTQGEWLQVGAAPEVALGDLSDVTISSVRDGQFLRLSGNQWRNRTVELSFDDRPDTPSSKSGSANHYLRVNAAGTALTYVRTIPASRVRGPLLFAQLPAEEICEELKRRGCFPEPPPPPPELVFVHTVGDPCVTDVGRSCTTPGEFSVRIENPQSLTPPLVYTWTRVSGVTLQGGNTIVKTSNQTQITVPTAFRAAAESGGTNNNLTRYDLTVTDSATPANTVTAEGPEVNYAIVGDVPVNPITSVGHVGGSVTVPPGDTGTATGSATASFDPAGTGTSGPYRYRWSVTDGGSAFLLSPGSTTPQTTVTTTSGQVSTVVSSTAPAQISRSLSVTVGSVASGSFEAIATAAVPAATYRFVLGTAPPPQRTLTIRINGETQPLAPEFGGVITPEVDGFTVQIVSQSSSSITAGTPVTLRITRADSSFKLQTVETTCSDSDDLNRDSDNRWSYTFVMPNNNCEVDVITQEIVQEHTLTTVVPSGFSVSAAVGSAPAVSGGFPNGALVPENTPVTLTIDRTDRGRLLDTVSGCGGTLVQTRTNRWTYSFDMPANDCTVTVTDEAVPFDPQWDGNSYAADRPPFAQEQFDDTHDVRFILLADGSWGAESSKDTETLDSGIWYPQGIDDLQARFEVQINLITDGIVGAFVPGELRFAGWRLGTGDIRREETADTGWINLGSGFTGQSIAAVGGWSAGEQKPYGCEISVTVRVRRSSRPADVSVSTVTLRSTQEGGEPLLAPGVSPPTPPPGNGGAPPGDPTPPDQVD